MWFVNSGKQPTWQVEQRNALPMTSHARPSSAPRLAARENSGGQANSRVVLGLFVAVVIGACTDLKGAPPAADLKKFQATERHMGTDFTIALYAPDETAANRGFQAAFARVRQLDRTLSDYDEASELSRLGAASPTSAPVRVSDDLWHALERSKHFHDLTDGAFEITVGPLTRLWRRSRRQRELPSDELLGAARAAVGQQHLRLHPETRSVELLRAKMRLDAGGIGQGIAADAALAELRRLDLPRAIVNASGDIVAGEPPPDAAGWKVGIAPLDPRAPPSRFLLLARRAVSTSGDAFQFVEIGGQRYSHIVDPKTGLGVTRRCSVSVFAPDATAADALATALCVLGPDAGMQLAERLADVEALFVYQVGTATQTKATSGASQWDAPASGKK